MINGILRETNIDKLGTGKAINLVGRRKVGKTTFIQSILESKPHLFLD